MTTENVLYFWMNQPNLTKSYTVKSGYLINVFTKCQANWLLFAAVIAEQRDGQRPKTFHVWQWTPRGILTMKFDEENLKFKLLWNMTQDFINILNNKTTSQEKNGIYFYNITSQKIK